MIKVENVTKDFDNRELFTNLNLNFEKGKVYALIGPSVEVVKQHYLT